MNTIKETLDDGTIVIHVKAGQKTDVKVKDDLLTIEHIGVSSFINQGLTGSKTYNLNDLTGVQFKKPGRMSGGYLTLIVPGTVDTRGGVINAIKDENSIFFSYKEQEEMEWLKDYIEDFLKRPKTQPQATSGLDNLKKLKELLDLGAITQAEFDEQKKKILEQLG